MLSHSTFRKLLFPVIIALGLTTPAGLPDAGLNIIIAVYVFTIVAPLFKISQLLQFLLVNLLVGIYAFHNPSWWPWLFLSGYASFAFSGWWKKIIKNRWVINVLPIIVIFLLTSFINSGELRRHIAVEPAPETYRGDLDTYLRTYYLVEQGEHYYTALPKAVAEDAFKGYITHNVWAWRLPTIYYLWKLIPGSSAISIYYAFLSLVSVTLFAAYKLVRKLFPKQFKRLALLSPYLLYPYFHYAARDQVIFHSEWWAISFIIIGIYCFLSRRYRWATFAITLAVLIRELFIVVLIMTAILARLYKDRRWWLILVPIVPLAIMILIHAQMVAQYAPVAGNISGFAPHLHAFSREIVLATLAYGAWEYYFYWARIFMLFYLIGVVGVIWEIGERYILLAFFLFPLTFLIIGSSVYNDYWGIFYMPIVLLSVPLVLAKYKNQSDTE